MSLTLHIHTHEGLVQVAPDGGDPTRAPLAALPDRAAALAAPFEHGPALFAALGGPALLDRLSREPDNTLYLDIPDGDPADSLAWECAVIPPRTFLVHRSALLRLVDREARPAGAPGPLRLIALGADALVDSRGYARETQRLDILQEMGQIERALRDSGQAIEGLRIAPTPDALQNALLDGRRSLLHLSCHGSLIATQDGPQPALHLEDANGGPATLMGDDLVHFASLADLRLVLLSACRTGQGYGGLTRALAGASVPAAIGLQGLFPDALSDDFAAALYRALLAGQTLGQALRAARLRLSNAPDAVGLPVAYVARGGDAPLPLVEGRPQAQRLDLSARVDLPGAVQPPEPLLGRNAELHALARLAQTERVITIIGTGGMGKTALAAAYARRFGLRYGDGVWGYSFAAGDVDDGDFRRALLEHLLGDPLADRTAEQQTRAILDALRTRDLLLLVDNYESVQQAAERADHPLYAAGAAIHGLLAKVAGGGGRLLITSRQQPAGLKNERVWPGRDRLLPGVGAQAAAELFYQNSPRAREERDRAADPARRRAVQELARAVGEATGGHPLAIALLGSEYDQGDVSPARFLAGWPAELAAARSRALDAHHATFAAAFDRGYQALDAGAQWRLRALSAIPFPFFAEGAARLWPAAEGDDDLAATRAALRALLDRSLLEIDGYYTDGTPATYRFQPAVQQEAARRLSAAETEALQPRLAHYAAWLSDQAYGDIHKEGNAALVRLVRPALDTLAGAAAHLTGVDKWRHLRQVGWLLNAFGRTRDAEALLTTALAEIDAAGGVDDETPKVRSSVLYELANLAVTRGDLDRALALYQESLQLKEQIGDIKGKAASLHQMAQVFLTRGDLDRALALYQESLQYDEQIGDIQGKAASLHNMAQVFLTRGDLDRALALYQESLQFLEQIGDIQGKAASLANMAQVFLTRGDLDRALALYQESLQGYEQIGDIQGKAASLHNMAQVFLTRGDLDRALALYQESLQLKEQIGDIQGKAAALSMMANVFWEQGDLTAAKVLVQEAIAIEESLGHMRGVAIELVKLGQIAQRLNQTHEARSYYERGLAALRQLGATREIAQVEQLLAALDGGGATGPEDAAALPAQLPPEQRAAAAAQLRQLQAQWADMSAAQRAQWEARARLGQALEQARRAAERQLWPAAITYQRDAVALARQLADGAPESEQRDARIQLSVLLYNLAGYCSHAGRHAEAVTCLAEVVAIDEETGHPDLAADRQALEAARQRAAAPSPPTPDPALAALLTQLPAEQRDQMAAMLAQAQAQLAAMGPEERERLMQALAQFADLTPEEQVAIAAQGLFAQVEAGLLDQLRQVVGAYAGGDLSGPPAADIAARVESAARQVQGDASLGEQRRELAALLICAAAYLRGAPLPPLPAAYAAHWAAWTGPAA